MPLLTLATRMDPKSIRIKAYCNVISSGATETLRANLLMHAIRPNKESRDTLPESTGKMMSCADDTLSGSFIITVQAMSEKEI